MGNHRVGQMFHAAALVLEKEIPNFTQEEALEKLDLVGNLVKSVTSSDAEFDDYANPSYPLGRWIVKAIRPDLYSKFSVLSDEDYENISDEDGKVWYYEIYRKFIERYGFW